MGRRTPLSEENRKHYYKRFLALQRKGLLRPAIAERLGIPYFTLCDIIERYELKGRYAQREAK